MSRSIYFMLCIVIILFQSCKKEKDEQYPQATWEFPSEFEIYHVFDTIRFSIQVSDESKLESAVIDISNENFSRVLPAIEINSFPSNSAQIAREIVIDEIHLPSGNYYIRVRLSDGENETVEFRACTIVEEPLEIKKIIAFRNNGTSTRIDTLGIDENNWSFAAESGFESEVFSINSWHQETVLAHQSEGQLAWLDVESMNPFANQNIPSPDGFQFWRDFYFDEERLIYVGTTEDGYIRTFRPGGNAALNIVVNNGFRAEKVQIIGNYLLAELQSIDLNTHLLSVYNYNTGVFLQSMNIGFDIVEIIKVNEDEALIFGNDNGNGIIKPYIISANNTEFALNINLAEINSAIHNDFGYYIVAEENELRSFFYDGNGNFTVLGISVPGDYTGLVHEKVSGAFLALFNDQIQYFDNNLNLVNTLVTPSGTERFGILYNK